MKPILPFYLIVSLLFTTFSLQIVHSQTCVGRKIVLHPDSNLGSYNNGRSDFLPGDTILLNDNLTNGTPGVFSEIWFQLRGTPTCPIIIMNDPALGHAVKIRGLSGQVALLHSQYVKFSGSGIPGIQYGITIDHSTSAYPHGGGFYGFNVSGRSKNVQLERVSIRNCNIGIHIKQDPGCIDSLNFVSNRLPGSPWYPNFVLDSIVVNDCYVVGSANEGMYIGNTGPDNSPPSAGDLTYQHRWYICPGVNPPGDPNGDSTYPEPLRMGNVHVYNNIVDSSGRGGIQIAAHDGVSPTEINNNIVRHAGMLGMYGQGVGISTGPYQAPYIHDNTIISTTSEGIATFGGLTNRPIRIENNYIDSSGYQDYYLHGESTWYPAENWTIVPNTNTYPFTSMYIVSRQVKYDVENDSIQFIIRNNKFGVNKSLVPDYFGNTHVFQIEDYRQLFQQNPGSYICYNTTLDGITPAVRPGKDVQLSTLREQANPWRNPQLLPAYSTACTGNQPPYGSAGPLQHIYVPQSQVTLNGVGNDLDGSVVAYHWSQLSGDSATISTDSTAGTTVTGLNAPGVRVFRLTVTDNEGATGTGDVSVIVSVPNVPPTANAGATQTITLPTSSVTQIGTGSDPDGTIMSYAWAQIGGAPATIVSPASATTVINGLTSPGARVFRLTVTDNLGATATSSVTINVNAANVAPTANAGITQTIILPLSTVSLSGTGSDPDGTIASYAWTQTSGTAATITSPASAATTVTGLTTQGVRIFKLTVTDNQGATGISSVSIIVNAPGNTPPVANAGVDQTIVLPVSTVTLAGSGTDANGTIATYAWSQVSGTTATILNPSASSTVVSGLTTVGVRVFRLTVTDNQGASASATVSVTVNPGINRPPVANAGNSQTITLPTSTANLTGSGTDPDGSIVGYKWTQVSGPTVTISNINAAATGINEFIIPGDYIFKLTVTDNQNAIASDTAMVSVKEALQASKASLFPNPATTIINVVIDAVTHTDKTSILIYNAQGQIVGRDEFIRTQQKVVRQIDISKQPPGLYYVRIGVDINHSETLKFVKM